MQDFGKAQIKIIIAISVVIFLIIAGFIVYKATTKYSELDTGLDLEDIEKNPIKPYEEPDKVKDIEELKNEAKKESDENIKTKEEYEAEKEVEEVEKVEPEEVVPDDAPIPMLKFTGYNKYKVTESEPNIVLNNPKGNYADFVFELTDISTGTKIVETEKISEGQGISINMLDFYKKSGTYLVEVKIKPYDENNVKQNGVIQEMRLKVERG